VTAEEKEDLVNSLQSHRQRRVVVLGLVVALALAAVPAFGLPGTTTRVSVDSAGNQTTARDGDSFQSQISADGRFTVFSSKAPDFVSDDGDDVQDIFVHDLETGATILVSRDGSGRKGNDDSLNGALSADGRYVVFDSHATNLVSRDRNGDPDVFVRDLQTGVTTRVTVSSTGEESAGASANFNPSISGDGRVVVFQSFADNLVVGDTNRLTDVFAHDRATGITTRVSVDSAGQQGNGGSGIPAVSADGRHVVFMSNASNLVANDTNGERDVFVYDLLTGSTTRVNVDSAGNQAVGGVRRGQAAISGSGRFVAFESLAANLVPDDTNGTFDIFVHDRQTGTTSRVSVDSAGTQGNGFSIIPTISADGRFICFESEASNLVAGDTNGRRDIFVHDRQTGVTTRESVDSKGAQSDRGSTDAVIAPNAGRVVFESPATNLVAGDTNGLFDVFVHDLAATP
jgi:Tol biopolymer transport system component